MLGILYIVLASCAEKDGTRKEEAPPFFKKTVPAKGSFETELYALYENGEIAFGIDSDVYLWGLEEMLNGQKDVEEYIRETEKRIKIYFGE